MAGLTMKSLGARVPKTQFFQKAQPSGLYWDFCRVFLHEWRMLNIKQIRLIKLAGFLGDGNQNQYCRISEDAKQ